MVKVKYLFRLLLVLSLLSCPLAAISSLDGIRSELENKKGTHPSASSIEILNVSYDPTREFYDAYNALFAAWWHEKTQQQVSIIQSHGGSGKQARAVIAGLEADVVSLALALDIDAIENFIHVVGKNWQDRLPNNSCPYYSTVVFLVRKGNPKNIQDWSDLIRDGISVITPNPKTSGGARWSYLAAWTWASEKFNGDDKLIKEFMKKMYGNTPFLDTGARGSTTTFVQRRMGDVLLTWENEAYLAKEKMTEDEYEIIYPSVSIRAEPPVAWLEKIIEEKNTVDVAKFYLKYLYSIPAQNLIGKFHFRPYDSEIQEMNREKFPMIRMVKITDLGGWEKTQREHFSDHGTFDEVYSHVVSQIINKIN
jgi:sulfate/thiosulfate-binding protein